VLSARSPGSNGERGAVAGRTQGAPARCHTEPKPSSTKAYRPRRVQLHAVRAASPHSTEFARAATISTASNGHDGGVRHRGHVAAATRAPWTRSQPASDPVGGASDCCARPSMNTTGHLIRTDQVTQHRASHPAKASFSRDCTDEFVDRDYRAVARGRQLTRRAFRSGRINDSLYSGVESSCHVLVDPRRSGGIRGREVRFLAQVRPERCPKLLNALAGLGALQPQCDHG